MLRTLLSSAVLLASADALAGADFLRPGQWELKMQIDREGKRIANESTVSRCVTAESLEKEQRLTFQPFETGCTGDQKHAGKDIQWTYECAGPPPMKGSGKLTFAKDRYWGESESFADLSGGKSLRLVRTQTKFKAERVGDCAGSLPAPQKKAPVKPSRPADPNETRAVVDQLGDRVAYVAEREVR